VNTRCGPPCVDVGESNLVVGEDGLGPAAARARELGCTGNTGTGQWRLRREAAYAERWAAAVSRWRTGRVIR